jgi:DNA polymerase-3 subunit delta'
MSASPANWGIWGNAPAVRGVIDGVAASRVSHAYIVSGPDGVGKTTLALAMAKALLCAEPPAPGESCGGQCLVCRKIERGVHPDVQTWSLASQIAAAGGKQSTKNTTLTIETMRAMISTAALRPMEGRWRVAIVDDAELLQETAQEALLKTLEEPPSFTIIFLLTDDLDALLTTIRSRGQQVELRAVPTNQIAEQLVERGLAEERAATLAALANGAPGWAIRAAADERLASERLAAIDRAIDWISADPHQRIVNAIKLGDGFSKDRARVFDDLTLVTGVWRDAMLVLAGQSRFVHFQNRLTQVRALVEHVSLEATRNALASVRACVRDLEANVRPRLALEHMVMQWPTR